MRLFLRVVVQIDIGDYGIMPVAQTLQVIFPLPVFNERSGQFTMLSELVTSNTVKVVISEGNEKDEEIKQLILNKLENIKTTYIKGNQENYYYYIYIENKDPNMPEIAILTDSVSDLSKEDIEGLPIKIVPLKIDIDGEVFKDGEEISKTEFWKDMIEKDLTIKTSQPSPQEFLNAYNKLFKKGYKKIISIHSL